ncbi:Sirohydrochlorin cobaltochelatase [Candidatus Hodgkinia cicadicola]|uniref:Sirohydrochlorin cobaltochelatase n=1 Tax=Candidatus Hodgkinia cicadicola TaxID=573658 RepID=A0ABX4MEU2_9HYPH|nr:Sirohydrochlorin cobaltochelatase [Candidatus Hodgkinia cicadicola]
MINKTNSQRSKTYLFFLGHGSYKIGTTAEFMYIVDLFKALHPFIGTGSWLLEFGKVQLIDRFDFRFDINIVVPMMLFNSKHLKYDVCSICNFLQSKLKTKLVILITNPCLDLLNVRLICRLLSRCIINRNFGTSSNTLILACRGSSDVHSNSQVYLINRILWEGMGFGWCEVGFIGITFPLLKCFQTIKTSPNVVVPLLLFSGDLYTKLDKNFKSCIITGYVFSHVRSVLIFFKRIRNLFNDYNLNNCILCKHRFLSLT